jgi:glutathione S-transferase
MQDIILHHYPQSPFSEKIRLVLGHKGLAWRSVVIPDRMPKPELMPLTGGYRRTPVMQIGADVYCDTQVIADALERLHPQPTLHPHGAPGVDRALLFWSDRAFFQAAVAVIFGTIGDAVPKDFIADRSKMMDREFDVAAMKAALPPARDQLDAHLALLEEALADGRRFLLGPGPSLADFSAYHTVWFLRAIPPAASALEGRDAVASWADRVAAVGHGRPTPLEAKEALEVARLASPAPLPDGVDPASGRRAGDRVRVFPDDYGRDPVAGELLLATPRELAIRRHDERVGAVVVHFPRLGFVVEPA